MRPCDHIPPRLNVELATDPRDILASQQLRYRIFAEEQGAKLESAEEKIDHDYYDRFCHHLIIKNTRSGDVVGSTRILTEASARNAGSFYSENEFSLQGLLPFKGNAIEIGRTCIHPDYRNGSGIAVLWLGLARFMEIHQVDYLFGCASISMLDGGAQVENIMDHIHEKGYLAPDRYRVMPHMPIEPVAPCPGKPALPPLLKAYLSLGAWVAGEPSFDRNFNVADLFILLDVNRLNKRYHKRFMRSADLADLHHSFRQSAGLELE